MTPRVGSRAGGGAQWLMAKRVVSCASEVYGWLFYRHCTCAQQEVKCPDR